MEQLWRHTHGPSNALVKPIYKPPDISRAQVHHNGRRHGHSRNAPTNELRMNHYWGARLQNWSPDTKESLAKTEEDRGLEPIVAAFKKCETYIQPYTYRSHLEMIKLFLCSTTYLHTCLACTINISLPLFKVSLFSGDSTTVTRVVKNIQSILRRYEKNVCIHAGAGVVKED